MVRQAEVVVGAQVEDFWPVADMYVGLLRRREHAPGLEQAGRGNRVQLSAEIGPQGRKHGSSPSRYSAQRRITLPACPLRAAAKASSYSVKAKRWVMTGEMSSPDCSMDDILYQVSYISPPLMTFIVRILNTASAPSMATSAVCSHI